MTGRIIRQTGGFYYVETERGVIECRARGLFRKEKITPLVGDNVEVGCNSVLCPGSVIGRNSIVYPLCRVRGVVAESHIYKDIDNIVERKI